MNPSANESSPGLTTEPVHAVETPLTSNTGFTVLLCQAVLPSSHLLCQPSWSSLFRADAGAAADISLRQYISVGEKAFLATAPWRRSPGPSQMLVASQPYFSSCACALGGQIRLAGLRCRDIDATQMPASKVFSISANIYM